MPKGDQRQQTTGTVGRLPVRSLAGSRFSPLSGSALVSRAEFGRTHLGQSFGGLRDINAVLGYDATLDYNKYNARFERGGIAERIVTLFPDSTWGTGAEIIEDEDPDVETRFEIEVKSLFTRLDLWSKLHRADILARIGYYSVLVIGAPGNIDTELPIMRGESDLLWFEPLPENQAQISKKIEDTGSERFGLPEFYTCKFGESISRRVHWTRIIHIAESILVGNLSGKPCLRAPWNYLDDLVKVVGGGAEASWMRASPGMQVDVPLYDDKGNIIKIEDESDLEEQAEEYQHGLRRIMYTRGTDVNVLSAQVHNFGPNAAAIIDLIAGTTGYPQRMLLGSERGELASSQDTDSYDRRVSERRIKFAGPIIHQLIDRLIEKTALPEPVEYQVIWPDEDELTEKEKSEVVESSARANQAQSKAGGGVILSSDEIRDRVYGLEPLEEEELEEREEEDEDDIEDEDEDDLDDDGGDIDSDDDEISLRAARRTRDEPEWKAVQRAAKSHLRGFSRAIRQSWADAAGGIDVGQLIEVLESKDIGRAESQLLASMNIAEAVLMTLLPDRILAAVNEGGLSALRSTRARGGFRIGSSEVINPMRANFSMDFAVSNQRSITWATLRSSALITQIGPDTRTAARLMIANGIKEGIPPRKLVQQIREVIGLRTDQLEAVEGLRSRLMSAKPGSLVKAGRMRIRVPKRGLSRADIESRASKYTKRLKNQRALLIARTETLHAANEGQRELWRQAVESGQLPQDQKRTWLRNTDRHVAMEGQIVGIDEPFMPAIEPGSEPNCGCSQGLV